MITITQSYRLVIAKIKILITSNTITLISMVVISATMFFTNDVYGDNE